jgi:hypothetical protein
MTIKTLIAAAAVAIGMLGMTNQADAQWRRYNYNTVYSYPTYSYSYPTYSPGVVYSSGYTYPTTSGVVVASGYNTPYTTSYYVDPYNAGLYNAYYGGYSNVYGNPYGVSVGTRGGMFFGRRAWRW